MSYRYERLRERRRRGNGCLITLVVLIWIVLLGVVAYRYWLRPQISQYIGQQIVEQVGQQIAEQPGDGTPVGAISPADEQIQQGAAAALPIVVAALPSGELRISEEQANAYLAEHPDALGPIDSATIRFVPNEIQADLRAVGTT